MEYPTLADPSFHTDPVTVDDLRSLATVTGPCVSFHMPTHRRGADVRQDPIRLRNLVEAATRQLREFEVDTSTVDAILEPVRALIADDEFWQHQADGLSVYAAPGFHRHLRVAHPLSESVTVADVFHVAPLAPLVSGDGEFLLLALSQNDVRLFAASRASVVGLDTGELPTTIADALAHEDPERQLQVRSNGSGDGRFHGHGAGEEYDKAAVERYLRAVDRGLHDLIGADRRPIVLACVAYYVPIFRAVSHNFDVVEHAVEGNPEHAQTTDLHAAAWNLVAGRFHAQTDRAIERYRAALGTGAAVETLDDVARCAAEGRIDVLIVDPAEADAGPALDRAILDTANASGHLVSATGVLSPGSAAGALLRF